MTAGLIVDLFAGPGGLDQGVRDAGWQGRLVGVEWDADACATAVAAGHVRVRADVERWPLPGRLAGRLVGLVGSPPCPTFSMAGGGAGRVLMDVLARLICDQFGGTDTLGVRSREMAALLAADALTHPVRSRWPKARRSAWVWRQVRMSRLVAQPARWIRHLRPSWVVLEQVPAVLPLWQTMAARLTALGYDADARILNAADYGVPQTRQRAFLLARRDGRVCWPDVTHVDPRKGASLFHAPWVSMAAALGFGFDGLPAPTVTGEVSGGGTPFANAGVRARLADVVYRNGSHANAARRPLDQPAPTVHFGERMNDVRFVSAGVTGEGRPKTLDRPADTLTGKGTAAWTHERPATTIAADQRVFTPGGHLANDGRDNSRMKGRSEDSIRVTVQQAAVLQGFRADYPWQGTRTSQYRQVGNAVPPPLAAAVLRGLIGGDASGR